MSPLTLWVKARRTRGALRGDALGALLRLASASPRSPPRARPIAVEQITVFIGPTDQPMLLSQIGAKNSFRHGELAKEEVGQFSVSLQRWPRNAEQIPSASDGDHCSPPRNNDGYLRREAVM